VRGGDRGRAERAGGIGPAVVGVPFAPVLRALMFMLFLGSTALAVGYTLLNAWMAEGDEAEPPVAAA
jgi:hypothetical protein